MGTDKNMKPTKQIVALLSELNKKVLLNDTLNYVSQDEYNSIMQQVKDLSKNLYKRHDDDIEAKKRLDELSTIIVNIADLDFSQKATVNSIPENHFDFVGIGLNLLMHQLNKTFMDMNLFKVAFNTINNPILVTDENGIFRVANKKFSQFYKGRESLLAGRTIKEILYENKWFQQYKLEIVDEQIRNGMGRCILGNLDSDVLLNISSSVLMDEDILRGYLYTIKIKKSESLSGRNRKESEKVEALKDEIENLADRLQAKLKDLTRENEKYNEFMSSVEDTLLDKRNNLTMQETWWLAAIEEISNSND